MQRYVSLRGGAGPGAALELGPLRASKDGSSGDATGVATGRDLPISAEDGGKALDHVARRARPLTSGLPRHKGAKKAVHGSVSVQKVVKNTVF